MQQLAQKGYTEQQVKDILHAKNSTRNISFKYILLDKNNMKKKELTNILSVSIKCNSLADIKKVARFTMLEDVNIDWLNDRVQPFIVFNDILEWSQGIYLLSTVDKNADGNIVKRNVEAYDLTLILKQDKVDSRYFIAKNTGYLTAIQTLLNSCGITNINIEFTGATLTIDKEFEIGTDKLTIVNALLKEINYTSIAVDENGFFIAKKYILPSSRAIDYIYKDNNLSILSDSVSNELDIFNVPNKFTICASNVQKLPLTSIFTNSYAGNPLSTTSRGRTISYFDKINDISDQITLDAYTKKVAYEKSNIYDYHNFETLIMPHHSFFDILKLEREDLNINDIYEEFEWEIELKAGSMMNHKCRKVIRIL